MDHAELDSGLVRGPAPREAATNWTQIDDDSDMYYWMRLSNKQYNTKYICLVFFSFNDD